MQLRQGPGTLDAVLGDACKGVSGLSTCSLTNSQASGVALTAVGHGCLQAVQRLFILTQVIGHVPISVDSQEVSPTAGTWRITQVPSEVAHWGLPCRTGWLQLLLGKAVSNIPFSQPFSNGPCPQDLGLTRFLSTPLPWTHTIGPTTGIGGIRGPLFQGIKVASAGVAPGLGGRGLSALGTCL